MATPLVLMKKRKGCSGKGLQKMKDPEGKPGMKELMSDGKLISMTVSSINVSYYGAVLA